MTAGILPNICELTTTRILVRGAASPQKTQHLHEDSITI